MRDPRQPATTDGYQRPQQAWQCGLADEGPACPLGPNGSGCCPVSAACRPVRDGERWHCNRSALRGGPCADGPGHDGACSIVYHCTPVRSLRTRRGRFVVAAAVATIGAACMALSGPWRNELIAPGPLSVHHAQLLEGRNATLRCTQCHAAGDATVAQWWKRSTGDSSQGTTQSTLCLACHGEAIGRESALAAHGVGVEQLEDARGEDAPARFESRLRDPREAIACAACHREHQGLNHNLTAMSDDGCQACHREQYDSFAGDHPEFAQWPYERRTRIAFDHASHQMKHYPAEKREFACAACHQADATGERQMTSSYATSCAECHDKALVASMSEGVPLVSPPTLDVETLVAAGHDVGPWPEEATGDFEGTPPMPTMLLLAADPKVVEAAEVLGAALDLYDVDPEDEKQLAAAATVAWAVKSLAEDLADRGPTAIGERLAKLLDRELSAVELAALGAELSPEAVRSTFSFRYRPTGHADRWMRAWLDVLAEAASGPRGANYEPLLRAALKPTAAGQCGSCHSVERDAAGRLAIQWRPFNPVDEPKGLTRFDHGPHVMQPQTGDCTSCHRIDAKAPAAVSYTGDDPHRFVAGFEPMTKASCVACHTANAAGDSCMQCHSYHGE